MNNKGQSLVLFILIIPILVGIMALVIDVGKVLTTKSNQESVIEMVLQYSLENLKEETIEEEKIKLLMDKNLDDNQNTIEIKEQSILISTQEEVEGLFSKLLGFHKFKVITKLEGTLVENKIQIKKIK